jgi:hypothetical protein
MHTEMFASEIVDLIFKYNLLDGYGPYRFTTVGGVMPSFAPAYLAHRVLNEPADGVINLVKLRQVAETLITRRRLSAEQHDKQLRLCVEKLSTLTIQHLGRWALGVMFSTYGRTWMFNYNQNILCAAAYIRDVDAIIEQLELGHMPHQSGLFGDFDSR